jgi:metallophosphoesterase (TIGR03767 family)
MTFSMFGATITKSRPNEKGWRHLLIDRREAYVGETPTHVSRSLINIVHISDTHICDAQSPARVEYLDRYADPHHQLSSLIGSLVGTYRAQEVLTTQVMESMIQAVNRLDVAPITKRKIDTVLITGDLTDNAQQNELSWCTTLLKGGKLRPDSGRSDRWEGAGDFFYSPFFWNPAGTPRGERDDFPRDLYGFPTIPELFDAIRAPYYASGLNRHCLVVHGNHDALLQGTVAPNQELRSVATSHEKIFELPDSEALESLQNVSEMGPAKYPAPISPRVKEVTGDFNRDFNYFDSWNHAFYREDEDNGITAALVGTAKKYWRKDFDQISIIALDTVNPFGGWQGSIDREQFIWLQNQVEQLRGRYTVITSHHPLQDLFNGYTPEQESRVLGPEIERYLVRQKQVIAWLCGHTHRHRMAYFGPDNMHGFWQIETASLIDWPQQGRIIEIFSDQHEQIWIANTPLNHCGSILPDPEHLKLDEVNELAGLSRILSVNDWQRRGGIFSIENNEGESFDRNGIVVLPKRI